jgi:hypothetical protein
VPWAFVVKDGSKTRESASGGMPGPVSAIESWARPRPVGRTRGRREVARAALAVEGPQPLGQERLDGEPDEILPGVAEHARRGGVGDADATVFPDDHDRLRRRLDDRRGRHHALTEHRGRQPRRWLAPLAVTARRAGGI